ncbi:MAG TPA: S-layer protein, partial [Methanothermococcus okinawensis]|nr:S-layer protein [Methanothermococcus okinawensis]
NVTKKEISTTLESGKIIVNNSGVIVANISVTDTGTIVNATNVTNTSNVVNTFVNNVKPTITGTLKWMSDESAVQRLPRLSTLIRDTDADPNDVSNETSADAMEFLLASVKKVDNDNYEIDKGDLVYGALMFKDGKYNVSELQPLYIGMEIPLLGENYRIVDVDDNDKNIYLGKEAYSGPMEEGETYDLGNGYQVKIENVLQTIDDNNKEVKVNVEIIKDGKVVASKDDKIPFVVRYKDIGVDVYDAYKNIAETEGYASVIITKDVKEYELGKDFVNDWKLYAITRESNSTVGYSLKLADNDFSKESDSSAKTKYLEVGSDKVYGLALKYDGDKIDNLDSGSTVDFANDYATLEFTDDDESGKLFARYKMDVSKEVSLNIGEETDVLGTSLELKNIEAEGQEVVPVKVPIAKLDTETSLDSDKNMILVGGPVANKLTKELQEEGKVNINNNSPAIIQLVGNNILVVAGGDREKTREAALYLIENY